MAGTGSMGMGTGMRSTRKTCIGTRTQHIHIRLPAGYTHTRVKHYVWIYPRIFLLVCCEVLENGEI